MENSLTKGNLFHTMLKFSIPYLIASFLQSFYGMADLFITGQFNGASSVSAVSIGSQLMHMVTVVFVGLAMGITVSISHAIGAEKKDQVSGMIGNAVLLFTVVTIVTMLLALTNITGLLNLLQTPAEALQPATQYVFVCFAGIPFIVAYNVISAIYRGLGDTKSPMLFVCIAGIFNVGLDYLMIGPLHLGAMGAAIATVASQGISVVLALLFSRKINQGITFTKESFRPQFPVIKNIFSIGFPIAAQDGLIQISFLVITMIANMRGLQVSTAVGVVEKVISFLFLVPSAMLSTVSAVTAQNVGAGLHERARKTLRYGILTCLIFGSAVCLISQFVAPQIVGMFVKDEPEIIRLGAEYLHSYSIDCIFAGVHFCFSGFFTAYGKSMYSFIHNVLSIILVRIPGTYFASILFRETLFPMGLAAPIGSLLSVLICIFFYTRLLKTINEM